MNLAEKLAATYLRLNGFLLLPHFTVFTGRQHSHLDLVAMRAANSIERVGEFCLPVDDALFTALTDLRQSQAQTSFVGVAAEVRTNQDRDPPKAEHIAYIEQFLGGLPVSRLAFFEGTHAISRCGNVLDIGMRYAGLWIQSRIDQMDAQKLKLTKTGSWTWSESFLADLLTLRACGLLTNDRNA